MSMTPPSIPFVVFDSLLAETYGVLFAGVFVSCVLFGVVALQVFLYYTKKGTDPIVMRTLPGFLITMEFIHQFLLCVAVYKVVINNFGSEGVATLIVPELFIASFFQGFCATSAHLFYTYRIWKFNKGNWFVPCITIPLTLTQLGFTCANNALTLIHRDIAYLHTITWTVYATHGVNVFLDIFFVTAMVLLLSKEKDVFAAQTQSMIRRLNMMIINTGLITTISTILTIIFVGVQPATFTYAFFNILVSPLYGNSVMANLNSREYVRAAGSDYNVTSSIELRNVRFTLSYSKPILITPSLGLMSDLWDRAL
ncbi:hypothetical protein DFH07DRAFT_959065 [Mycena maculata]|uniref:DUF6534 domain-containing protein n=1 Tax=Mycena maculata TaxID=230809 RepID=A0AAD7J6Z9_9AGAR|nr:hypothetical protein DFH07DRAFT_959065 [Mycena maculata]